jgi:hypothetical protein
MTDYICDKHPNYYGQTVPNLTCKQCFQIFILETIREAARKNDGTIVPHIIYERLSMIRQNSGGRLG